MDAFGAVQLMPREGSLLWRMNGWTMPLSTLRWPPLRLFADEDMKLQMLRYMGFPMTLSLASAVAANMIDLLAIDGDSVRIVEVKGFEAPLEEAPPAWAFLGESASMNIGPVGRTRRMFSLCHELAHARLQAPSPVDYALGRDRSMPSSPGVGADGVSVLLHRSYTQAFRRVMEDVRSSVIRWTADKLLRVIFRYAAVAARRVCSSIFAPRTKGHDFVDIAECPGDPHSADHRRSRAPTHARKTSSMVLFRELAAI